MKAQKALKWFLVALLMSAMTFELLPGSVQYYAKGATTETAAYNFFTVEMQSVAASCLPIAGIATFVLLILGLVAACFKKVGLYKIVRWGSLGTAALAAMPYVAVSENEFLQPNVMVILIMTGCWLLAASVDKQKNSPAEGAYQGRRL